MASLLPSTEPMRGKALRKFADSECAIVYVICRKIGRDRPRGYFKKLARSTADYYALSGPAAQKLPTNQCFKLAYDLITKDWTSSRATQIRELSEALSAAILNVIDERDDELKRFRSALALFLERDDWMGTPARELLEAWWKDGAGDLSKKFAPFGTLETSAAPARNHGAEAAFSVFGRMCARQDDITLEPEWLLDRESGDDGEPAKFGARYIFVRLHTRDPSSMLVHGIRIARHYNAKSWSGRDVLYFSETYSFKEPGLTETFRRTKGVCFLENKHLTAFSRASNSNFFTHFVGHIEGADELSRNRFLAVMTSMNGFDARFSAVGICFRCDDKDREEQMTGNFSRNAFLKELSDNERSYFDKWQSELWAKELMDERPRARRKAVVAV